MSGKRGQRASGGGEPQKSRACVLDSDFREDLEWWVNTQPRVAGRLLSLMEAALRSPFSGIGKPEPLKQLGPNIWSRRLTAEHRMVYVVYADRIVFVQGRYHY
ncbi:MAG: Txe/YoeB family addiction module toxin [Gemmatimonadaceae bacterium]